MHLLNLISEINSYLKTSKYSLALNVLVNMQKLFNKTVFFVFNERLTNILFLLGYYKATILSRYLHIKTTTAIYLSATSLGNTEANR